MTPLSCLVLCIHGVTRSRFPIHGAREQPSGDSSDLRVKMEEDIIFLGFDCSTQSLKVTALDTKLRLVGYESVHFDSELPHYKTKDGVHRDSSSCSGRVSCPPLMWVEALELLLNKLVKAEKFPLEKVRAIAGSAQQHGSVYWRRGAKQMLQSLNPSDTLASQLESAFSLMNTPIWMDSSSTPQCRHIEETLGGAEALTELTGSRALERYTGPQIRKLYQTQEDVYNRTERISLISSFMACLLIGDYASIDYTDGAGMSLMDLRTHTWMPTALQATAPNLEEKLGKLAAPHAVAGRLHSFFVKRYNFSEQCHVIQWSGDNPNSLAGLALEKPGDLAISLGTSDTVFGVVKYARPGLDSHTFPNPVDPTTFMCMLCYKNGSLTRQDIRDRCATGSWEKFNLLLDFNPPLNGGRIGFYFKEPEALPPMPVGIHRFFLGGAEEKPIEVPEFNDPTEVRAVVEGQFLAMRTHANKCGMPPPDRIIATGGASANLHILRVMADVFGCNIYTADNPDSASLGAALRAGHGYIHENDPDFTFSKLLRYATEESATHCRLAVPATGNGLPEQYGLLAARRLAIENMLLQQHGYR